MSLKYDGLCEELSDAGPRPPGISIEHPYRNSRLGKNFVLVCLRLFQRYYHGRGMFPFIFCFYKKNIQGWIICNREINLFMIPRRDMSQVLFLTASRQCGDHDAVGKGARMLLRTRSLATNPTAYHLFEP